MGAVALWHRMAWNFGPRERVFDMDDGTRFGEAIYEHMLSDR